MKELTKAEEQVMHILWKIKRGFIRDILDQMPEPRPAYNTVSTIVRILEKKGFIDHKAYGKTHEYFPSVDKSTYTNYYINRMVNKYFSGSFESLVSFFARENKLNANELEQLIRQVKEDQKG